MSYMSISICALNVTTLFCKHNKLKYKIFYVNVTYKPKTQGWAIYISYRHEIVYIVIWHVTEIKILLTYLLTYQA